MQGQPLHAHSRADVLVRRAKLLFVCSHNKWRSLTAEKMFEGSLLYDVRSAGTDPRARIRVTAGHIGWADCIFAMEKKHVLVLRRKYAEELEGKQLICLRIDDRHAYMDPELVELLKERLKSHVHLIH